MSIQAIIRSLEELIRSHEDLLDISEQKTALIKDGSTEELQPLLVKERKEIRLLEQAEEKRQSGVEAWFLERQAGQDQDATLTNLLEIIADETEQKKLEDTTIKLTEIITKLKQQEELNQSLLNQSMQFVQLTMGMMNPSMKEINYGKQKQTTSTMNRSVFDSQV
jgi:flagellar biosynthesis/type III secretory pathway chaperone